jgi:hypothetical protein
MTLRDAMVQAQAISIDNRCGQHVNRRLDGDYYTSDWYNEDSTVITYDRGRVIFVHGWITEQPNWIAMVRTEIDLIR